MTPLEKFRNLLKKHGIYEQAISLLRDHRQTLQESQFPRKAHKKAVNSKEVRSRMDAGRR